MNALRVLVSGAVMMSVPLLARAQDSATPTSLTASAATPVDAARIAAARQTVNYVFPAGTYGRIMGKSLDAMMGPMMDSMGTMPISALAGMGGLAREDVAKLGKGTLAEMMTILDPAYRERLQITTRVMTAEMTSAMTQVEPGMREALSNVYAKRFDLTQLGELNRFFATPTGRAYASESMTIMADPDMLAQMQAFMPLLLKRMPGMMSKVQDATASLPKPRRYDELTPAEKQRLQALMGQPAAPIDTPPTS